MPLHGQTPSVKIWLLLFLLAATAFGKETGQIGLDGPWATPVSPELLKSISR